MSKNAAIGWDNLLETADSIVASGEAQNFEALNLADWRTNTAWKAVDGPINNVVATFPTEVEPSAFGLFHHNLNDFGATSIQVQYWDNADWQNVVTLISGPPTPGVVMAEFDLPTAPAIQWRLVIATGGASNIPIVAHWFLGHFVRVGSQKPPLGPARYNDTSRFRTELSESGQFLGRTFESTDRATSIGLDLLQSSEVESDLFPWMEHAKYNPFYYAWDLTNKASEAAYCWTEQPITVQYYRTPAFMRLNARLSARVE